VQTSERERHEQLVSDLSARLRKACGHLSDDEFSALAHDIARVTTRFRQIEQMPGLCRTFEQHELALAPLPKPPGESRA
jgi:hypothetical protein